MSTEMLANSIKGVIKLLAFVLLTGVSLVPASAEERRYMGIWQKGTGSNLVTPPLAFSAFLDEGAQLTKQGLRLVDVESFPTADGRRYVGVWRNGSGGNLIVAPLGSAEFQKKRLEMMTNGLRLVDFEVFLDAKAQRMFIGVWRNGTGAERLIGGFPLETFVSEGEKLISEGLRLVKVETLGSGAKRLYFGLWQSGKGSNLVVGPLRPQDFAAKLKELTGKGLRLIDLDVVREGESQRYISVWADGPGENRIILPLSFPGLVSRGEQLVKEGYRLIQLETFEVATKPPPRPGEPPPPTGGSPVTFPPLPAYIEFTDQPRLIVDFSSAIVDPPRITIPRKFLPLLPTGADGRIIFPDNFCGIRVRQASRFVWLKDGAEFTQFPFNNVPQDSSVSKLFGPNAYLGGIDFTGPIGACESKSSRESWRFFSPFTQTSEGPGAPDHQLKLVIEMEQGSEIEFLNFLQIKTESLPAYELFKDATKGKLEQIMKLLSSLEVDSGYCGIDRFVRAMCDEAKADGKPGECLIGEDFESRC